MRDGNAAGRRGVIGYVTIPRFLCLIMGLHRPVSLLIRQIDGRLATVTRCSVCGAV